MTVNFTSSPIAQNATVRFPLLKFNPMWDKTIDNKALRAVNAVWQAVKDVFKGIANAGLWALNGIYSLFFSSRHVEVADAEIAQPQQQAETADFSIDASLDTAAVEVVDCDEGIPEEAPQATWRGTAWKATKWLAGIATVGVATVGVGYVLNRYCGFTLPGWGQRVSAYAAKADKLAAHAQELDQKIYDLRAPHDGWFFNGDSYSKYNEQYQKAHGAWNEIRNGHLWSGYQNLVHEASDVKVAAENLASLKDAVKVMEAAYSAAQVIS